MWFPQLALFRLPPDARPDLAKLEAGMEQHCFAPPSGLEWSSQAFVAPASHAPERLLHPPAGGATVPLKQVDKVLPAVKELLQPAGEVVALIKPQFEAGRENVGKKGVVREPSIHVAVIKKVVDFACSIGFMARNLTYSPVKGPEGNIEYLVRLDFNQEAGMAVEADEIAAVVEQAHASLDKSALHK